MNWKIYMNRLEEEAQRMVRVREYTRGMFHRFKQLEMCRKAEKWCARKRRKALK